MRLLLDTQAMIWTAEEPELVPDLARDAIENPRNSIFASAVSAMEIAAKYRLGRLQVSRTLAGNCAESVEHHGFIACDLTVHHAQRAGLLRIPHRDPFDRLLIAQSMTECMILVSNEARCDAWHVTRLWSKPLYKEPNDALDPQ